MQADLRLCWSHIPHCWKSHALAQYDLQNYKKLKSKEKGNKFGGVRWKTRGGNTPVNIYFNNNIALYKITKYKE